MKLLKITLCTAFVITSAACMKPNKGDSPAPTSPSTGDVQGDISTVSDREATAKTDSAKQKNEGAQSQTNANAVATPSTLLSTDSETVSCLTDELRSSPQFIVFLNALFGQLALSTPQSAVKIEQTDFTLKSAGWIFFKKENQLSLIMSAGKINKEKTFKINFNSSTGWQLTKNLDNLAFKTKNVKSKINLIGLLESKGRNLEFESNCLKAETLKNTSATASSVIAWPSNVNALTTELRPGVFERIHSNTNYQEIEDKNCALLIGDTLDKKSFGTKLNRCIEHGTVKKSSAEELCDLKSLQTTNSYQQYKTQRQLSERLFAMDQNKKSQPPAPAQLSLENDEFEVNSKTFDKKGLIEADSALIFKVESAYNEVILGLKTCSE